MADALIDERRKLQKAVAFMIHGCMARPPFHAGADWAAEQVQERRLGLAAAELLAGSLRAAPRLQGASKQERTVEVPVVHFP